MPTVGVDAALHENDDPVRISSAGGNATFVDALPRPPDVCGCGRLGEDRSVCDATGGAQPEWAAHTQHKRRLHRGWKRQVDVAKVDVVALRAEALTRDQAPDGDSRLLERAHRLRRQRADLLHPRGHAVSET